MPIRPKKLFALAILMLTSFGVAAQTPGSPQASPSPSGTQELLKPAELEALVAPIALYPDSLLSLVLMASTYPLEVVQADRWLGASRLKGDELKAAVDKQGWDDSVKSLAATPSVLTTMSTKLDWTQKLGDAVLAQQEDVMDAVQRLRARAQSNDTLKTTKEQTVTTRQVDNKQVIVVEQTDPNTVYVPYYEPSVAYGTWPYAEYPPYYWGAPGYIAGGLLATGLAFGTGYALGRWASGGNWWGGGVNWGNRNIISNRPVNINNIGNNWAHRPEHRHGVRYNNAGVAQKFAGDNNLRSSAGQRQDFRGRDSAGPGGDRAGPGGRDRPGGGDKGNAANRDRPGGDKAGNRDRAGGGSAKGDRGAGKQAKGDRGAGKQAKGGSKAGNRTAANRGGAGPGGGARAGGAGPRRDAAFGNISSGRMASAHSMRGHASLGGGAGRSFAAGGGGFRGGSVGMGGGGFRGGGGGGFRGGGGGGRRSDIALKHDIELLGHLGSGLGFYRFSYIGETTVYAGVMAQDVQRVMPGAVTRDAQGFLRVSYDRLGLPFQTYDQWIASKTPALVNECTVVPGICRPAMQ